MRYQSGPVQIRDIAGRHRIPQHYLEQILVVLKRSGIVASFRGAQGGYALSRPPDQIRLEEVLSALEGKLEIIAEQHKENALSFFWQELHSEIRSLLNRTIEDLISQKQQAEAQYMYSI